MKRQAETLYETVYKVRTKTYHDIVRTFCSCPNGLVAKETYDGYVCVNGHSIQITFQIIRILLFFVKLNLTSPVENTVAYAKSIAEVASTIGGGKPHTSVTGRFKCGRRSTWSRLEKTFVTPFWKMLLQRYINGIAI
jgi:uncharacterized FAD-dependent dehydrogenase